MLALVVGLLISESPPFASAQSVPGVPTGVALTAQRGALNVSWAAPADTGGSAITSYDVRHILSDAGDKGDDHWTLTSGLSASGTLEHALTGLGDDARYDVQVRAVNAAGTGAWSETASAQPMDHGSSLNDATLAKLDSVTRNRISVEGDVDLFKLVLAAPADVWAYTTGGVDTLGEFRNAGNRVLASNDHRDRIEELNFSIRRALAAGTYYIRVASHAGNQRPTGRYFLHIRAVVDPGGTAATATPISLDNWYAGRADSGSTDDHFRLTVTADTWVKLTANVASEIHLTADVRDSSDEAVYIYVEGYGDLSQSRLPLIGFEALTFLTAGAYVIRVSQERAGSGGRYEMFVEASDPDQTLQRTCSALPQLLSEPLSGCQWHLKNTGRLQSGGANQDINVEGAWNTTKGAGITVAVIDGGFQPDHPDLKDNILTALNHSHTGSFFSRGVSHGTAVAGLIAARDNGFGMVGVAPRASIYGSNAVRTFGGSVGGINSAVATAAALLHLEQTAVSNNSWGPGDDGRPVLADPTWHAAIHKGITEGFGGKGIVYVFGAGNGGSTDYSNASEYTSHYGVVAACAVDYDDEQSMRSESGSNLWVCAPSNHQFSGLPSIYTTWNGSYTAEMGGTSAASAIVAGVVALVRAANLNLTWRDVRLILAATARKNDSSDRGWEQGAVKYGSTARYNFNHDYGFGMVDAAAAVALAQTWTLLPDYRTLTVTSTDTEQTIDTNTVTSTVAIAGDHIEFVEYATVNFDVEHDKFRELKIELTSPSGSKSTLLAGNAGFGWQLSSIKRCARRSNSAQRGIWGRS